ncbi:MAG: hypothetical protein ACR2N3_04475 [Pyrinomonadaceae bacterium]
MNASGTKIWTHKQKEREKKMRSLEKNKADGNFSKQFYLLIAAVAAMIALAAFGIYAYRNYPFETPPEMSGNIIQVKAGGNFQDALNHAKSGDTIQLQSGATFSGNFVLPNKAGNEFITIRASANDSQLPPSDTRIDPKKYAAVLPKLVSPTEEPVISASNGAHHYRFVGVEFGANKNGVGNIIQIGTTEEKRIEDLPHNIEFDRVYIHGSPTAGQRRGIAANGKFIRIINSYISDIKREGEESQAIAIWATDGPVEIVNNYLEAASENILFGGAGSTLKLVPTDCLVKDNWMNKPLEWRGQKWLVKNIFEIKFGKRIKVENNLMTNNWGMGQDGSAVLFTTRADIDKETIIEDIEFKNNIIRNSDNGINVYGSEGSGGHHLTIHNNFFEEIGGQNPNETGGRFMKSSAWDELVIENNTIINSGNITSSYDAPVLGFVFRNNIVFENEYGFKGDGTASGASTIEKYFPGGDVSYNAIVGAKAASYRGKNLYPVSIRQIGFADADAKDFRLRPDSPLRAKGFQGKNIGADLDAKTVGGK